MPERDTADHRTELPGGPALHPDTAALRAMAHPVRLQILGLLRSDGPATATSLATRLGLNSGATSYHLRQLAGSGLIVEDAERGSKRDRWWKAAHQVTRTDLSQTDDPEQRAATLAFVHAALGRQVAQIQAADAERDDLPREWQNAAHNSDFGIRMTPAQADALLRKLSAVLFEAMEAEPDEAEAPDDAAPFVIQVHGFPRPGAVANPAGAEADSHDSTEVGDER